LATPIFATDQDLWDNITYNTMSQFWAHYPNRVKISAEEEKQWLTSAFESIEIILRERPHTKEARCTPQSFRSFPKECAVRTLAIKGREQDAMNYADIEDKYNAARIILVERFMRENNRFRSGLNIGFMFPYLGESANGCPLSTH
jgi:hypothetical protein